jgi:hypothetical protein
MTYNNTTKLAVIFRQFYALLSSNCALISIAKSVLQLECKLGGHEVGVRFLARAILFLFSIIFRQTLEPT